MMLEATMGLSPELQAMAHKLVRTPKTSMLKAIDCKKKDSYEFLLSAFRALEARISSENATIFAEDAKVIVHLCAGLSSTSVLARALALRRKSATRQSLKKHLRGREATTHAGWRTPRGLCDGSLRVRARKAIVCVVWRCTVCVIMTVCV
jgi:hypothetical protein